MDITQLGKLNYKQLLELNAKLNPKDVEEALQKLGPALITPYTPGATKTEYYDSGMDDLGSSIFDEKSYSYGDVVNNNFSDIRSHNQPAALQLVNGVGKMAVLAGTTFLDGIGGLITGIGLGILNLVDDDENTGFLLGLWDNPFSRAMLSIQEWSEKIMPNYRSRAEMNRPWWENLGTANFWADTVIKNLGFAIGAASGAGLISKGIRAIGGGKLGKLIAGVTRSSRAEGLTNAVVGNSIMALNEGRVEALHNATEWAKTYEEELNSMRDVLIAQAEAKYGKDTPEYLKEVGKIREGYKKGLESLEKNRIEMGNATMGLNVPVLMLNNMFMYSKLFSGGANTLRRSMLGRVKVSAAKQGDDAVTAAKKALDDLGENATKAERRAAQKALKQAERDAKQAAKGTSGPILDVLGHIGLYIHNPRGTMYGIGKWLSHGASEGAEELAQRMVSEGTGLYHGFDVMEAYKAGKDPKYKKQAADLWKATVAGWDKSFGDPLAYEEFAVGAITGLLGIPLFRSRTYRELQVNPETGELEMVEKKRSPIYLAGGLTEIMKDLKVQNEQEAEIVKYLNDRILDPKFLLLLELLADNIKTEEDLEAALKNNDLFQYNNKEFLSLVKDVLMFSQAGRIQDFKDLVNHFLNPSKQNAKELVEATTSIVQKSETEFEKLGWLSEYALIVNMDQQEVLEEQPSTQNKDKKVGKKILFVDTPEAIEGVLKKLELKRDRLITLADRIEEVKSDIDRKTGGRFSNDDLTILTNLRMTVENHQERARTLIKENLPQLLGLFRSLSEEEKQKLQSLISTTSGYSYTNETNSRIDPRLRQEEVKNEKDSILEMLTNTNSLTDALADTVLSLFDNNAAFTKEVNKLLNQKLNDGSLHFNIISHTTKAISDALANKDYASLYNKNLNLFLNKPDKLQEAIDKADMEIYKEYLKERVNEAYNNMKDIDNVLDLRLAIEEINDPDILAEVGNKIKKEGNELLLNLIQEETAISALGESLESQVSAMGLSANANLELSTLFGYIKTDVYDSKQAEGIIKDIIDNGEYKIPTTKIDTKTGEEVPEDKVISVSDEVKEAITKAYNNYKKNKKYSSTEAQEKKSMKEFDDLDAFEDDDVNENADEDIAGKEERKKKRDNDFKLGKPEEGVLQAILHLNDLFESNSTIVKSIAEGRLDSELESNGWSKEDIELIKEEAKTLTDYKNKDKKDLKDHKEDLGHVPWSEESLKSSDNETVLYDNKKAAERTVSIQTQPINLELGKLGVYSFVDDGKLGTLLSDRGYDPEKTPIHYIKNIPGYPALQDRILLAVEVRDPSLADNAITVEGKHYQVVGVLSKTNKEASSKSYDNISKLIEEEFELKGRPENFIYSKTNRVRRIYAGRIVTADVVSLKDILPNRRWEDSKEYALGFVDDLGDIQILGKHSDEIKGRLIQRNKFSTSFAGTRFLITKEADGKYYLKSLRRAYFDNNYLRNNPDSEIVKYIKSLLEIIAADEKVADIHASLKALRDLQRVLFLGGSKRISITKGKSGTVIKYLAPNDAMHELIRGDSAEEIASNLLKALADTGYLFLIPKNATVEEVNRMVISNAITTDLLIFHNVNADFVLYGVDEQGDLIGYNRKNEIEISTHYMQPKESLEKLNKTILFSIDGNLENGEYHYYPNRENKWTKGLKQEEVSLEESTKLDECYAVASSLRGSNTVAFASDNSFAVKKLGVDRFDIITDMDEIQKLQILLEESNSENEKNPPIKPGNKPGKKSASEKDLKDNNPKEKKPKRKPRSAAEKKMGKEGGPSKPQLSLIEKSVKVKMFLFNQGIRLDDTITQNFNSLSMEEKEKVYDAIENIKDEKEKLKKIEEILRCM